MEQKDRRTQIIEAAARGLHDKVGPLGDVLQPPVGPCGCIKNNELVGIGCSDRFSHGLEGLAGTVGATWFS